MIVVLDPGIELLGVVDLLGAGGKAPLTGPGRDYARALIRALAPYKKHPAVALNARLRKMDPTYFQRKDLLLLRSAPPALAFSPEMSCNKSEAERSGAWEPWLQSLRDFARVSRFPSLLRRAAPVLKPALAELRAYAKKTDHAGRINGYTGMLFQGRYRLVVSALCERGKSLNRVWNRDDGLLEIASVLRPTFRGAGERAYTEDDLDAVVWHELGHGVLDITANLYDYEERDAPFSLGAGLENDCRNWLHGIREHFVRAVMLRLIAKDKGEAASARQFKLEGFSARPHLAAFVALLKEYEAARERYPTLADFYPRLRAAFPRPRPFAPAAGAEAGPFYTEAQRARAVAHIDLLLERSTDERLLRRREALLSVNRR